MKNKLFGVGINDSKSPVTRYETINGKRVQVWICPYYQKWRNILRRCYCEKFKTKRATYADCTVGANWLLLSGFKEWVDSQPNKNWLNCDIDKDLLIVGNKHYSPETCVFISPQVNQFIRDTKKSSNNYLMGVCFSKWHKKFTAQCKHPLKDTQTHLGYFDTEMGAHLAWKAKKHEFACILAESQEDERVSDLLKMKYI